MCKSKLMIIIFLLNFNIIAQNKRNDIIGGKYPNQHILTKRMIPYEFVREADVIWSRRIWQSIDLREKINHPLYFPFDYYDSFGNWMILLGINFHYELTIILLIQLLLVFPRIHLFLDQTHEELHKKICH